MFLTWAGRQARVRLAVAGVTLGVLVAAAVLVSVRTFGLAGPRAAKRTGPVEASGASVEARPDMREADRGSRERSRRLYPVEHDYEYEGDPAPSAGPTIGR